MIGFRADANANIGFGHVIRLLSIAKQCIEEGETVIFYTDSEEPKDLLNENGIPCEICDKYRTEYQVDVLVVDSYAVSREFFLDIKRNSPGIRIVYIDDLFEDTYPVDMLINCNVYAERFAYLDAYTELEEKGNLLLGAIYAPLREQFINITRREISSICDNVLLTVGGGDQKGMLVKLTEKIRVNSRLKDVDFHIVVGGLPQNQDKLVELANDSKNLFVHKNVKDMAGLMRACDLAISAAGTTLLELASLGVPTICFVTADNQKYDGEYFAINEQMIFAGSAEDEDICTKIIDALEKVISDRALRKNMSIACGSLTDGKGAVRIAKALIALK